MQENWRVEHPHSREVISLGSLTMAILAGLMRLYTCLNLRVFITKLKCSAPKFIGYKSKTSNRSLRIEPDIKIFFRCLLRIGLFSAINKTIFFNLTLRIRKVVYYGLMWWITASLLYFGRYRLGPVRASYK